MNFNQFVIRNTIRNKHLYLAYFLSTMFSVMIFFTFTGFVFHPALANGLNPKAQMGMTAAAIIIYGFSFLFVLYSMDVFIQSRKKEFGTLMIQGMSPKQLKKMIFIENLVIGFFATIFGSILGVGFSQFILWISNLLMHLGLGFYLPVMPFIITVISFAVLFLVISFFIQFRLPKATLQELLKAGEMGKGEIKSSKVKSFLAVLLLIVGYGIALVAKGQLVLMVMFPVILLVILGTKFLFDQLSVSVIERLKRKPKIFWKKTNMVVLSDLAFRMKDNARSFFLVSVISTVAFAAIGTLYGVNEMIFKGISSVPYELTLSDSTNPENQEMKQFATKTFQEKNIQFDQIDYTMYKTSAGIQLIKTSEYNKLAKFIDEPTLTGEKVVNLSQKDAPSAASVDVKSVQLGNDQVLNIDKTEETNVLPTFGGVVVIPDSTSTDGIKAETETIWQPKAGTNREELIKAENIIGDKYPMLVGTAAMSAAITQYYTPVLFVGLFIGIVFFVSAGSFLYFRLYSDMNTDVEKFKMIYKLGLTKKELKKMIYQQVGILFFTPIVVSFIHGAVALKAMYTVLDQPMQLAGWEVLGVFLLIQVVYYLIARTFYFKKVYHLVKD